MADWTLLDMPSQQGRSAVVTGTGGLGFETALALARAGADVIVAGRNANKGAASVSTIRAVAPRANVRFERLDLASLDSVWEFANRLLRTGGTLDLLVNNAGVMAPRERRTTRDGFELQFGTNYLGHFALTAWLAPLLRQSMAPRVVSVSSSAHRGAKIRFEDLQWERGYRPAAAYGQSKLALLMFTLELQRRCSAAGWNLMSNAAHPGFARTELIVNGPGNASLAGRVAGAMAPMFSHSAAEGVLSTLHAATNRDAQGGGYYGPSGFLGLSGMPAPAKIDGQAYDRRDAERLWVISEHLTGTSFEEEMPSLQAAA